MDNEQILNEIHATNNHSYSTKETYKNAVKLYCSVNKMDLYDLIVEAEEEENKGVKWKLSSLKRRLLEFRQFLLQNYSYNSFKTYFRPIIRIYGHYDIEINELPKLNQKGIKKPKPLTFRDLPDKEIIRQAVNISTPFMKAVILFMCSSGCSLRETMNLTIKDYIESIGEYTNKKDVLEAINDIKNIEDVVPTWEIWRQKTNKYYTTHSSPESVNAINSYLITREDELTYDSKLFHYHTIYVRELFYNINKELNLGTVGDNNYGRFRSHMLRKFHASALYNDGMSLDKVNDLQGKAKNKTDEAYFMTNPEDLKNEYINHLSAVTINKEVEKITIKSKEFLMIEKENSELKSELNGIKAEILGIKKKFGA